MKTSSTLYILPYLAIFATKGVSCLTCYSCFYSNLPDEASVPGLMSDPNCEDGDVLVENSTANVEDGTPTNVQVCGMEEDVCYVYWRDEVNGVFVRRGCAASASKYNGETEACQRTETWGGTLNECVCQEDNCNGAMGGSSTSFGIILFLNLMHICIMYLQ